MGETENFRSDEDPQHQLDDHDRGRERGEGPTATVTAAIAATTTIAKKEPESTSIMTGRSYDQGPRISR